MEYQGARSASTNIKSHRDVREWSEKCQREKGDCRVEDGVLELPQAVFMDIRQTDLTEPRQIWDRLGSQRQEAFTKKYGDIALLLRVVIDEPMLKAAALFWDPVYRCFTFNKEDMTPTIEEYTAMLRIDLPNPDKICYKELKKFGYKNKLAQLMGIDEAVVDKLVREKGETECIHWDFFRDYILRHFDEERVIDVFALTVYGLIIFLKTPRHVEVSVIDLFDQVCRQSNPAPSIIAETIRSLSFCRKKGEGRFVGCAQMLYVWIRSHFWGEHNFRFQHCFTTFVPIEEFCKKEWPERYTREQWVATFRVLTADQVTWKAPWMSRVEVVYRCGNEFWVPLLGIWGVTSYAPLLVRRQNNSEQFTPVTYKLTQCEFDYVGQKNKKKTIEISKAWKETHRIDTGRSSEDFTLGYEQWRNTREKYVNLPPQDDAVQFADPQPKKILTEVEMLKQEFQEKSHRWEMETSRLQGEATEWKFQAEAEKSRLKKIVEERDMARKDLNELSLQHKRLGEQLRYAPLRPSKKPKGPTEEEIKITALEKEIERLNINAQRKEEECRSVTLKLRNKTLEAATLKVELREERNRNSESEEQKKSLKRTIQELEHMFLEQRHSFVVRREEYEYEISRLTRLFNETWNDKEAWKTQCFARQMYIKHVLQQIGKAIMKANEMLTRARELREYVLPVGRNGQRLVNFLEEAEEHYRQLRCFHGFNSRMLNFV